MGCGLGRVVSTASPGYLGALHAGAAHSVVLCLHATVPMGCVNSDLVLGRHLDRCVLSTPRPAATTNSAAALQASLCQLHTFPVYTPCHCHRRAALALCLLHGLACECCSRLFLAG